MVACLRIALFVVVALFCVNGRTTPAVAVATVTSAAASLVATSTSTSEALAEDLDAHQQAPKETPAGDAASTGSSESSELDDAIDGLDIEPALFAWAGVPARVPSGTLFLIHATPLRSTDRDGNEKPPRRA